MEAIHLALTGVLNSRYIKNELTEYLFNKNVVDEYLSNLAEGHASILPHIKIEVFFEGENLALFEGDLRATYIQALRSADGFDYQPLIDFVRS